MKYDVTFWSNNEKTLLHGAKPFNLCMLDKEC